MEDDDVITDGGHGLSQQRTGPVTRGKGDSGDVQVAQRDTSEDEDTE